MVCVVPARSWKVVTTLQGKSPYSTWKKRKIIDSNVPRSRGYVSSQDFTSFVGFLLEKLESEKLKKHLVRPPEIYHGIPKQINALQKGISFFKGLSSVVHHLKFLCGTTKVSSTSGSSNNQYINGWCLRCWRLFLPAPLFWGPQVLQYHHIFLGATLKLSNFPVGVCNFYLRVFQTPSPTESQVWRVFCVFGIPQDKTALHVSSGKYRHCVGWFYITSSMDVFKTVPRMNMFLNPSAPNTLLEGV